MKETEWESYKSTRFPSKMTDTLFTSWSLSSVSTASWRVAWNHTYGRYVRDMLQFSFINNVQIHSPFLLKYNLKLTKFSFLLSSILWGLLDNVNWYPNSLIATVLVNSHSDLTAFCHKTVVDIFHGELNVLLQKSAYVSF